MKTYCYDDIDLIDLEMEELERFFSLNEKGLEIGLTDEEIEELESLYSKGRENIKKCRYFRLER